MARLNINDLPYRREIFKLAEAMQYAYNSEPTSDYDIQNKRYWLGEVYKNSKLEVAKQIKETQKEHAEELASSPLLRGLLDMYVAATEAGSPEELKAVYTAYQALQKDIPFEDNKEAYVDAGCILTTGYLSERDDEVFLTYPIFLHGAYTQYGGRDDDNRGGYLFPVHKLSPEELKDLHDKCPDLFAESSPKVRKVYAASLVGSQPEDK